MREEPVRGEIWRHFKGGIYKIIAVGLHTETLERLVVYECEVPGTNTNIDCRAGDVYVRPYEMFMSKVDREKYPDADQEYRLERIDWM